MTHYDYIVVGAGSAGCVLANRLSASGRHTVALIEAGREDNSPLISTPLGIGILVPGKRYNWHYHTEAQAALNQRRLFWPRGKVLGGSSSINAMMYTRGHATDYDDWAQLGNDGWSYAEVLPYFRKAEHQQLGANEFHGADGPLHVSNPGYINPMSHDAYQAGLQAGFRANDDFNGAEQEGWGYYQMNTVNGQRCSTAKAYIEPVR
jgi:choline dehydrogenase